MLAEIWWIMVGVFSVSFAALGSGIAAILCRYWLSAQLISIGLWVAYFLVEYFLIQPRTGAAIVELTTGQMAKRIAAYVVAGAIMTFVARIFSKLTEKRRQRTLVDEDSSL
ncbi:MAG TPA: hypothetical protein PKC68_06810 [Alphaproteobacteria bacterium]|jgi:hypothetical protein|nr:hypothetical protein [Alphaproteobacteria bacterium]HMS45467.1 hypothetical protein [Alphaproteobacteria bacterium]